MLETVVLLMMLQDPMPTRTRLELLGGYQKVHDDYWAAKAWREEIRKHFRPPAGDPFPSRWRAWAEWHNARADLLYDVYDNVTSAWSEFRCNRDVSARGRLMKVRELIGEQNYWAGRLPPVPTLP